MRTHDTSKRPPARSRAFAIAAWIHLFVILAATTSFGATPGSGTLSTGTPTATWTGSVTGAGSGENTCIDGVSCDSFQVVLAPGDYTGRQINVSITWTVPAYDYDLYVHVGTLRGASLPSSAGPPPATSELVHIGIDPPVVTTPRIWWAHIQAASVPPLQTYSGSASLAALPAAPVVTHLPSSLPFSATVPLFARGTVRALEPSVRVDVRGNCYVSAIRGVPAGVDLWRIDLDPNSPTFDPEMRNAAYLGQPDVFQQEGSEDSTAGGADGGGDIDIACSVPSDPDSTPVITMVSLAVANISSNVSSDRGDTFEHNGASALIPSDDRQWIEATGENTVYMFYRGVVPASALFVQKSTDHGRTYGAAVPVIDNANPVTTTPGYIDVDHTNGIVYVSHQNDNAGYVSRSSDGGATWVTRLVDGTSAHGHLFDPVKVGDDGTVYVAWSNDRHIFYSYSKDHGETWTPGAAVDDPDSTRTNVFPWLEAGSDGRVDVVWFGTRSENVSAAEWDVYFAQSLDANTATPTFYQQRITDHRVHGSNISEGGLTGAANRNLGDYFQIAYDPQGAAVVAFGDDHNDFDGNTYVTRQLAGPSLLASANGGTGMVNAVAPTELPAYLRTLPEVVDPVHDAVIQVQPVLTDNPFDIVSIKYFTNDDGPDGPYVGARMTLSGLAAATPGTWRIAFTANAPEGDQPPPYGVSDHGDMFYLLAADSGAVRTFTFGTAYRDSQPALPLGAFAMAYNPAAGLADSGAIDTTTSTVTIKVSIAKINALVPPGHAPLTTGSWLAGLRGSAGSPQAGPKDNTRGGLVNFRIDPFGVLAVGPPGMRERLSLSASPNPAPGRVSLRYAIAATERVSLGVYDVQGRLVKSIHDGAAQAGVHVDGWDGRDAAGKRAPHGVYFARITTGGGDLVSRFVLLR